MAKKRPDKKRVWRTYNDAVESQGWNDSCELSVLKGFINRLMGLYPNVANLFESRISELVREENRGSNDEEEEE